MGVNEEMPVEKILEAETAVEQKTELHSEEGSAANSVSDRNLAINAFLCIHSHREVFLLEALRGLELIFSITSFVFGKTAFQAQSFSNYCKYLFWMCYWEVMIFVLFGFSPMMQSATSARLQINSCLPWWSGQRGSPISLNYPLMTK